MSNLIKRVVQLEKIIKPDAVPMVHYVYLDENDQPNYEDIPESEFRAGQASGKYPPAAELIEILYGGDNSNWEKDEDENESI